MSFVVAAPDVLGTAAADLSNIGSTLGAANAAAAAPTTGVLAAAEDEVSAAIAAVFSGHAQAYQAMSAQAAGFHAQFVQALTAGADRMPARKPPTWLCCPLRPAASSSRSATPLSELVGSIPGVDEAEVALDVAGPAVVALPGARTPDSVYQRAGDGVGGIGRTQQSRRRTSLPLWPKHGNRAAVVTGCVSDARRPLWRCCSSTPISATVAIAGNPHHLPDPGYGGWRHRSRPARHPFGGGGLLG